MVKLDKQQHCDAVVKKCVPIVKWVGGKRQLLSDLKSRVPENFNTYYEPFFGGGALFFELKPQKAVINDSNKQLINLYQQIRDNQTGVIELVSRYQNQYNTLTTDEERLDYYYKLRSDFNTCLINNYLSEKSAALFLFLNKSAFNGVYRVNSKGLFNVPSAKRKTLNAYDVKNIQVVADCLSGVEMLAGDFEQACSSAKNGDFVFFDSPYFQTFDTYQAGGFTKESHERLAQLFTTLTKKGVKCMLTNSNTDFIKDLYKDYNIEIVDVKRMINRNANERTGREVIITNYTQEETA